MKVLSTILVIVIIVVSLLTTLVISALIVVSNLKFKPFEAQDIASIKLTDLLSATNKKLTVTINSYIENKNNFPISFSDLYIQIFYNNQNIASSPSVDITKYTIPANGSIVLPNTIEIYANGKTIDALSKIALKQLVEIEYIIDVKVDGVKIPKRFTSDKYIIQ